VNDLRMELRDHDCCRTFSWAQQRLAMRKFLVWQMRAVRSLDLDEDERKRALVLSDCEGAESCCWPSGQLLGIPSFADSICGNCIRRFVPPVRCVQRDLPHICNFSTSCQLFMLHVGGRHNSAGYSTAVVTSAAVCQLCPSL
jgi:hypothetical protein